MKYGIILATATAIVLATAGCSAGPDVHARSSDTRSSAASAPSTTTGGSGSGGSGDASRFCALARSIGRTDLGVSSGNEDPDTKKLLAQVDQLDALAPADLKSDFDKFTAFEHSVLEPGKAPQVSGDPSAALKHVGSYFVNVCHVG